MPRTAPLRLPLLAALLLALALVTGCNPYVAGYKYATDPRETSVLAADKAISTEILARFADSERVGLTALSASTFNGHVYLVGEYDDPAQRAEAESIAAAVEGVSSVTTYARPRSESDGCNSVGNLALAQEVAARLVADEAVHGYNIDVKALSCDTIVLLGLVAEGHEIDRARSVARSVKGVRKVVSYVRVYKPQS